MNNRRFLPFLLLFPVILLFLALPALAQSGGGYDLHWRTVDGGGYTWSEGGDYRLGGTVGQTDAAPEMSGGSYSLQGGFWHAHCSPQVVDVDISCTGDQVQLDWIADSANKAYAIYRSDAPYQTPVSTAPLAQVTAPPWTDDHGSCADASVNYYYVVRSVCVGAHADAAEQGEFDFELVPGQP